jgi:hypothetical protein
MKFYRGRTDDADRRAVEQMFAAAGQNEMNGE